MAKKNEKKEPKPTSESRTPRHLEADAYARHAVAQLPTQPTRSEIRQAFISGEKYVKGRIAHNAVLSNDQVQVDIAYLQSTAENIMLNVFTRDAFVAGGKRFLPETEDEN